jgi:hypothetical protein
VGEKITVLELHDAIDKILGITNKVISQLSTIGVMLKRKILMSDLVYAFEILKF